LKLKQVRMHHYQNTRLGASVDRENDNYVCCERRRRGGEKGEVELEVCKTDRQTDWQTDAIFKRQRRRKRSERRREGEGLMYV
jgi:hypothetical protein